MATAADGRATFFRRGAPEVVASAAPSAFCALASVISLGYYLRLVWAMFIKPPTEPLDRTDPSVAGIVFVTAILMFPVLTVIIQVLLEAAARASGG